ncbi:uncharacterized protein LOC127803480 [Diospyros lotus]|uniref:uncharacterized protein LOC127803480 n=1 Tax=Diospyros lotus TaxID=55363 RepID=UPI002257B871|nr:uncharacterized protein LOC127803480 [Diospyros lotus]
MRTRNNRTPKSAAAKKTPAARKSATKTPPTPPPESGPESSAPGTSETKTTSPLKLTTSSNLEEPVEQAKASTDAVEVTPETKVATGTKTKKTVVRKTPSRTKTPNSANHVSRQVTPKSKETGNLKAEESSKKDEPRNVESVKKQESSLLNVEKSCSKEEPAVENVEETMEEEDLNVMNVEEPPKEAEKIIDIKQPLIPNAEKSSNEEDPAALDAVEPAESHEPGMMRDEDGVKEEMKEKRILEDEVISNNELSNMKEDADKELKGENPHPENEYHGEEKMEEGRDQEVKEFGQGGLAEDDIPEHGEEAKASAEERLELNAVANEHKLRKELEIFVGGLDHDAMEDDVKKAFENVGEVVEVRLHKNPSTNKNKGYAFVRFATKEEAARALSELKNPVICGKRCGTAPNEDNNTLFLGNICNTWTKEAIKQKLKDYGIEDVENITLVSDPRHEGLSRGFAFLEFSCHPDAMTAYKRLQKPDVIFGHPERTAKVAFAEPLREPDPEVMAQVKSVFIDGLPPHWDEDQVREQLKCYGEIVRVMLARNMSTAKRKDFGFVDFVTHEAAIACVEGINNTDLGEGNTKIKVKARLSNPLPKTQAVKGGMCGGFRIGHGGAGSFSNSGRGFGRHAFNRPNFQRGRGFHPRGRGQTSRMGFIHEHEFDVQYPPFHRREMFGRGGWRDSFEGPYDTFSRGPVPARPDLDMIMHDAPGRDHGRHNPTRRQPFIPEEGFNRPFVGSHFDDPYFYDESAHGIKRPFFMTDSGSSHMEPSRFRPRLDYSDPEVPFRAPHYQDPSGAGGSLYSHDYYRSEFGEGSYSSFHGNDRPYGGGYYY